MKSIYQKNQNIAVSKTFKPEKIEPLRTRTQRFWKNKVQEAL